MSTSAPPQTMGNDEREAIRPEIYERDAHSISRKQIDPDALKIMYRLLRHGFKAYLVGGGVRDLLLERKPKDYDIATDATPRRVKALFSNSRIIGRRFKLVHVFFGNGKIIEVATFRDFSDPIEVEETPENGEDAAERPRSKNFMAADNKYGTEVTDALRRDLTINGLFYDLATFSIIDYVGGVRDLADGIIRIIGNPSERFVEDPVRMVRAVRHAAKTGFRIEPQALAAIAEHRALIRSAAPMRLFEELKKDLVSGHLLSIMRLLAKTELLEFFLPELVQNYPALFDDKSFFSKVIRVVDEQNWDHQSVSSTVALSLLALATKAALADGVDPREWFGSAEELREHINGCFRLLAVPRRERERIESLLLGWFDAEAMSAAGGERGFEALVPRDVAEDFGKLLEVLGFDKDFIEECVIASARVTRPARRFDSAEGGREGGSRARSRRRRSRRGGRRNRDSRRQ